MVIDGIKYVTEKEASAYYGLSVGWLRKMRYSEKGFPYYKLNRKVYYKAQEVDDWFKQNLKSVN